MLNKPLDQITKADIESLVENEVGEGKNIDYKLELPGRSDGDKKDFLADVTSFANSGGGDIIFGLRERVDGEGKNTGIPDEAVGLPDVNLDQETLRLESSIREGIAHRIPGIQPLKEIVGFPSGSVFILRIPKSWASPHMITFQNTSRFYSRTSNGKYQMDVMKFERRFSRQKKFIKK